MHRSILLEAHELVHGDRGQAYGPPAEDFETAAEIATAMLRRKGLLADGATLEAADIPLIMIAVKLSRECYRPKRDNRVDIAGYAETMEMCNVGVRSGHTMSPETSMPN